MFNADSTDFSNAQRLAVHPIHDISTDALTWRHGALLEDSRYGKALYWCLRVSMGLKIILEAQGQAFEGS